MQRSRRWLTVLCLVFAVWPHALAAQQVRGVVLDSAAKAPIAGAVVSLLDSAGQTLVRALTDEQGRYRLLPPRPATRVRVARIGFRPREVALGAAGPAGDVTVNVAMVPVPRLLEAVEVTGQSVCPARRDRGQALALWQQARDGLLATVVARETNPPSVRSLFYLRELDPRNARIVNQRVHGHEGISSRPFVAPRQAADFAIKGYMREDSRGRTFEAPDADVLLDESFFTTHCFGVQSEDGEHRDQVGLVFVPAPGRDTMVEISGVLWMDKTAPALRTLEFRYTALEPPAKAAGSGGSLTFATMPNGVVLLVRWSIRLAGLGHQRAPPSRSAIEMPNGRYRWEQYDLHVTALSDSGAELVSAWWPGGMQWNATLGTVLGHVVGDPGGEPIANVRVWLEGSDFVTTTDSTGGFAFDDVLPGPYTLWARDSTLAGFGIVGGRESRIEVVRGLPMEARIEMPSAASTFRATCPGQPLTNASAVLFGQVLLAGGAPASDVAIDLTWVENLPGSVGNGRRTAQVDAGGRFHVCGVIRDHPLRINVMRAGETVATVPARVGANHYVETIAIRLP